MHRNLFFLFFWSWVAPVLYAQEVEEVGGYMYYPEQGYRDNVLKTDSVLQLTPTTDNVLYLKEFSVDFKSRYQGADFNYSLVQSKESLWAKIQRKLNRWMSKVLDNQILATSEETTKILLRFFAIVVVALLFYFLIHLVISKEGNLLFGKRNKNTETYGEVFEENIHEINFPKNIAEFEIRGDYRSAIRYHFLFVLKKLSDKNLIDWNPEKTNKDYRNELVKYPLGKVFDELSRIFDYVWYGEFQVNVHNYQRLKQPYENFSTEFFKKRDDEKYST